ncbi:hypothetical protein L7F22_018714 [Adiantum nelumboides]|nr:hypothetical protein [Adiantum nelumboides]
MSPNENFEQTELYELAQNICRPANACQISQKWKKVSRRVLELLATKPGRTRPALKPIVGNRVAGKHPQLGEDEGSSRHTTKSVLFSVHNTECVLKLIIPSPKLLHRDCDPNLIYETPAFSLSLSLLPFLLFICSQPRAKVCFNIFTFSLYSSTELGYIFGHKSRAINRLLLVSYIIGKFTNTRVIFTGRNGTGMGSSKLCGCC